MRTVDIGCVLGSAWSLYKENFGTCILAGLLVMLMSGVTCGVCSGPITCGMFMVLGRLIRKSEPKPVPEDVFKGFDFFMQSFLLWLVCGIVYSFFYVIFLFFGFFGMLPAALLGAIYGGVQSWSLILIVNRRMTWTEALGFVFRETTNGRFLMPMLAGIVGGLIGGLGVIACCVGVIFTFPFANCVYAVAYEQVFGAEPEVVS